MIRTIVRAVALLVLSSVATVEAQTTTAIIGARVIDGTGTPARLETVVVQGGRILAVSPNAQIPPGARVLDWPARLILR
jgi:imidazolonepropionase-like amidohydrolase